MHPNNRVRVRVRAFTKKKEIYYVTERQYGINVLKS